MDALIGHTGFVGGTIARSRSFDAYFRSTTIDEIRGRSFGLVVCCGVRAEKWKANRDPDADHAAIARLTDALSTIRSDAFVLISTVDVYPRPVGVDEATPIDEVAHPYGLHRLGVERFCMERFATTVVRLPALYGRGLKKNALYDLLHENQVEKIHPHGMFQFYDVERIWADVERIRSAGIGLVNITAEPLSMSEIATIAFDRELHGRDGEPAPRYDVRSRHANLVGGASGYWFTRAETLAGITRFVRSERRR